VHAHLAAQDEARVRLALDAHGGAIEGILSEAKADGGGARREGEESARPADKLSICGYVVDLLTRYVCCWMASRIPRAMRLP